MSSFKFAMLSRSSNAVLEQATTFLAQLDNEIDKLSEETAEAAIALRDAVAKAMAASTEASKPTCALHERAKGDKFDDVTVRFPANPGAETTAKLKELGFAWTKRGGYWYAGKSWLDKKDQDAKRQVGTAFNEAVKYAESLVA